MSRECEICKLSEQVTELEDNIFILSHENETLKKKLCSANKTVSGQIKINNFNVDNIQKLSNENQRLKTIVEYLESKNV